MQQLRKLAKNSIERFRDTEAIAWAIQKSIDKTLERHKRLGESVAVWQDGKVAILEVKDIPNTKD
jgi:hypothetical protein